MNENTIEQIKLALQPIAEKIGEGAEFGWEVIIRQQYVNAIMGGVWFVVSLLMIGLGVWLFKKLYKKDANYNENDLLWVVSGVLFPILLLIAATSFETLITRLLNPAYYAIEFLLTIIK
jgi:hypothetical protein